VTNSGMDVFIFELTRQVRICLIWSDTRLSFFIFEFNVIPELGTFFTCSSSPPL
jgi:hypothetical protein